MTGEEILDEAAGNPLGNVFSWNNVLKTVGLPLVSNYISRQVFGDGTLGTIAGNILNKELGKTLFPSKKDVKNAIAKNANQLFGADPSAFFGSGDVIGYLENSANSAFTTASLEGLGVIGDNAEYSLRTTGERVKRIADGARNLSEEAQLTDNSQNILRLIAAGNATEIAVGGQNLLQQEKTNYTLGTLTEIQNQYLTTYKSELNQQNIKEIQALVRTIGFDPVGMTFNTPNP